MTYSASRADAMAEPLDDLREEMRIIEAEHEELMREHYPSLNNNKKKRRAEQAPEPESEEKRARDASKDTNIRLDYSQELKCGICLELVSEPVVMCKREHLFCGGCFDALFKAGLNRVCPTCKEPIGSKPLRAPRIVATLLQRVPLACIYPGCPHTSIPKLEYEAHKTTCPHQPAACPNRDYGCGWTGKLGTLLSHQCEFLTVRLSAENLRAQLEERSKRIGSLQLELDRLAEFVKGSTRKEKFDALSAAAAVTNHSIKLQFADLDEVRQFDFYGCKFAVGMYAYERDDCARVCLFLRMLSSETRSQDRPLGICARVASKGDAEDAPTPFVLTHGLLAPPLPPKPLMCKHAFLREAEAEAARGATKLACKCREQPRDLVPFEMSVTVPDWRPEPFPDMQRLVPHLSKLALFFKLSVFIEPVAAKK